MKRGAISQIAGVKPRHFDLYGQRGELPFVLEEGTKSYSIKDALMLRVFVDLIAGGLKVVDAQIFVQNGFERVEHGMSESSDGALVLTQNPRGLFDEWDDEIWIAREVWTADYVEQFKSGREFSVTWWGGTKEEVFSAVAFRNAAEAEQKRETLSVQLYSLSKARAKVLSAAKGLDLPELAEPVEHV